MERPRLLLVPLLTELEWVTRPGLEEWAEVASYDAPGVGDEPPVDDFGSKAIARRGLDELERLGWDRFMIVADEFGVVAASHIAAAVGPRLQAIVLGHARLSNSVDEPRPAINREVLSGVQSLIRTDPRTFVRQMFKMTGGAEIEGGYGEAMVDEYVRRVPAELQIPFYESRTFEGEELGARLATLTAPMLLAKHEGCLLFTDEGFEDAVAAFPRARVFRCGEKPSTSVEFVEVLRDFCTSLAGARA